MTQASAMRQEGELRVTHEEAARIQDAESKVVDARDRAMHATENETHVFP
jgi:hypothetical protein